MGYTTEFFGAIDLSHPLTLSQARELLEVATEGADATLKKFGIHEYLQWVPSEDLQSIVWDQNEKFYEYKPLLQKVCDWLKEQGIQANGSIQWRGEVKDDTGVLEVENNIVTSLKKKRTRGESKSPLTLYKLADMAIDQISLLHL